MGIQDRRERALVAAKAWQHSGREPATKGKTRTKQIISASELGLLIDACGVSAMGTRARAMLAVLYGAQVKIGAACAMRVSDDLPPHAFPWVFEYVDEWRARRSSLVGDDGWLFCAVAKGSLGRPTVPSYWRHRLTQLADKAGVPQVTTMDIVHSGRIAMVVSDYVSLAGRVAGAE